MGKKTGVCFKEKVNLRRIFEWKVKSEKWLKDKFYFGAKLKKYGGGSHDRVKNIALAFFNLYMKTMRNRKKQKVEKVKGATRVNSNLFEWVGNEKEKESLCIKTHKIIYW